MTGIVTKFPLAWFRVEQHSMSPHLNPGDYLIVNRWAYAFRDPRIGEIIVLKDPEREGRFLCKRVAGVTNSRMFLVRGENAAVSRDSRSFGPVSRDLIVGRVWTSARTEETPRTTVEQSA